MKEETPLQIGDRLFHSRLFLGTARFPDPATLEKAVTLSGTQMVTVSLRRINPGHSQIYSLLQTLPAQQIQILPNTAGCFTAKEAILTAQLAREALQTTWIKLEVIGDKDLLYPDMGETLRQRKF